MTDCLNKSAALMSRIRLAQGEPVRSGGLTKADREGSPEEAWARIKARNNIGTAAPAAPAARGRPSAGMMGVSGDLAGLLVQQQMQQQLLAHQQFQQHLYMQQFMHMQAFAAPQPGPPDASAAPGHLAGVIDMTPGLTQVAAPAVTLLGGGEDAPPVAIGMGSMGGTSLGNVDQLPGQNPFTGFTGFWGDEPQAVMPAQGTMGGFPQQLVTQSLIPGNLTWGPEGQAIAPSHLQGTIGGLGLSQMNGAVGDFSQGHVQSGIGSFSQGHLSTGMGCPGPIAASMSMTDFRGYGPSVVAPPTQAHFAGGVFRATPY